MNTINVGDFLPIFNDHPFLTKILMHGGRVALRCVRY